MSSDETVIAAILFGLVVLLIVVHRASVAKKARERAAVLAATQAYQDALDHLAQHPTDPQARVACLERGRAFYALTIPDTFTLVVGDKTFGAQDYQNNTAGREARIAADIEARVGHLKVGA